MKKSDSRVVGSSLRVEWPSVVMSEAAQQPIQYFRAKCGKHFDLVFS